MIIETKKDRELRAEKIKEARVITELAKKEERELTDDEAGKVDELMQKAIEIETSINRSERLNKLTTEQEAELEEKAKENDNSPEAETVKAKKITDTYWKFQRFGFAKLSTEEKELLELRAQQTTTDSEGGYLVPDEFSKELEVALLAYGGMREVSTVFKTTTGATLDWPTIDSTSNTGEWLAEGSTIGEQDETFGNVQFEAWTASSKVTKVSRQLLQDSAFDLPTYLKEWLITRIGRLTNVGYTTGNGSGKPHGVTVDATTGKTAASASAITFDEIIDLKGSLDPAYLKNARFMFNTSTLKAVSQLKDSNNQYLWNPNVTEGAPSLLLGHPYTINQQVADIGASAKCMLFGDFKKYRIRDVMGFILLRLDELYAAKLRIGFIGFLRTDGRLLDAGTEPIQMLVNAVS